MMFSTVKCQEIFRNRFTGISKEPFLDFHKGRDIKNYDIDKTDLALYSVAINDDIASYYYKSLLSFVEGVAAISRNNLSWATIKLYYSVFYGLRCSLLCRKIIILRAKNYLYYIHLGSSNHYETLKSNNDHAATHEVYSRFFNKSDFLCSNTIEDYTDVYHWLSNCRDIINYKEATFHDPEASEMWDKVVEQINIIKMNNLIDQYIDEKGKYCFLPEHAILAIPVNRILSVAQEIKNESIEVLSAEQKQWIESIIMDELSVEFLSKILFRNI